MSRNSGLYEQGAYEWTAEFLLFIRFSHLYVHFYLLAVLAKFKTSISSTPPIRTLVSSEIRMYTVMYSSWYRVYYLVFHTWIAQLYSTFPSLHQTEMYSSNTYYIVVKKSRNAIEVLFINIVLLDCIKNVELWWFNIFKKQYWFNYSMIYTVCNINQPVPYVQNNDLRVQFNRYVPHLFIIIIIRPHTDRHTGSMQADRGE